MVVASVYCHNCSYYDIQLEVPMHNCPYFQQFWELGGKISMAMIPDPYSSRYCIVGKIEKNALIQNKE